MCKIVAQPSNIYRLLVLCTGVSHQRNSSPPPIAGKLVWAPRTPISGQIGVVGLYQKPKVFAQKSKRVCLQKVNNNIV